MRLMTKQYGPRDLREACAMPREDAVWIMEHCAEAWEADRQRLEEARLAWEECNFVELDAALAAGETYPSDAACTRHLGEPWPCPRCAAGEKP